MATPLTGNKTPPAAAAAPACGNQGAGPSPAPGRHSQAHAGRRTGSVRRRRSARAFAYAPFRASAGGHRRPKVEVAQGAQPADDARVAGGMAGRQARHPVFPHRSAEDRPGRGDRDDVQRLCRTVPHPSGRRGSKDAHRRDERALHQFLVEGTRRNPETRRQAGIREPGRDQAFHGRVLQPRPVDEARAGGVQGPAGAHRQLRAAGRAGQARQPRCQRPARRPHRRLALAIRVRAARVRHSHRAAGATPEWCAFASMAYCTRCTPFPRRS